MKKILYVGFLGHNNLGDELLFDLFEEMSGKYLNTNTYQISATSPYSFSALKRFDNKYDIYILGGGSLFTPSFSYINYIYKAVKQNKKVIIWGSGIDRIPKKYIDNLHIQEDFDVRNIIDKNNRKMLIEIIEHSVWCGVRGPLTYKFLKAIGANMDKVEISGDPGLLLDVDNGTSSFLWGNNEKIIGVNWAIHKDKLRNMHEIEVENQLAVTLKDYILQGYKIYMYSLWKKDIEVSNRLYRKINDNVNVIHDTRLYNQNELMGLMKNFHFTINYRLHASVISCASGVPYISLGNRFKDLDFAHSIDLKELVISTESLNIKQKINGVSLYINANREEIINKFNKHKQKYSQKLITPFNQNLFY
jgi:polysaccharide pyruvyl transferase WcaK-like protein